MENAIWNWKDTDVHSLIRLRTERNGLFTGRRGTAKRYWDDIAAKLAAGASGHQCKKKWENLVTKYKSIIIPPTGEGLEEHDHDADTWPFFDVIDQFMSNRHTIKPILTLQSASCTTKPQQPSCQQSVSPRTLNRRSTSSAPIPSPHPSPTLVDYNLSSSTIPALVCSSTPCPFTTPPGPSSAPASYNYLLPSTTSSPSPTPRTPPRRSSASGMYNHPLQPLCHLDEQSGSSSWSSSYSGEDSVTDDSISIVATKSSRKRRRTTSQSNEQLISELVVQIKAEMEENRRQQEEARKNERCMLEISKSILDKK